MNPDQQRAYAALGLGPIWLLRAPEPLALDPISPAPDPMPPAPSRIPIQQRTIDNEPLGTRPAPGRSRGNVDADPGMLSWEELQQQVSECRQCGLCSSRRQTVFGTGPHNARLLIVGEAPGQEEDASGEPFVGAAGKLLDSMLNAIGMNRDEHVFIANVLKCRPPGNRNPEPGEVAACSPYLQRQVALLAPRLILVMGRFAAQALLQTDASIASLRGREHRYQGAGTAIPAVVTYHPAYLLRNLPDKAKAWTDLLIVRRMLADLPKA